MGLLFPLIILMVQHPRQITQIGGSNYIVAATICTYESWALKAALVVIPSPLLFMLITAPFRTRNGNDHAVGTSRHPENITEYSSQKCHSSHPAATQTKNTNSNVQP